MNKINVALVGAGGIGKVWSEVFSKSQKCRLVAVIDKDVRRAKNLAATHDGCLGFQNLRDAAKETAFEAVIVGVPHVYLSRFSKEALVLGKHVLCEKPGGICVGEITAAANLAKKKGLIYMIGFNHRYHPAYVKAKALFDDGKIGNLHFIRARYGFGGRPGYEKEWRFKKEIAGGGELLDQGVHMIDMARWFMGDVKSVTGIVENMFWKGDVEDNAFLLLRGSNKKVASIHVSWTNWEWVHSFEVYGDRGYLVVEGLDQRYRGPERLVFGKVNPRVSPISEETTEIFKKEKKEDSFVRELSAFAEMILGYQSETSNIMDAQKALWIIEKIYKQNVRKIKK